jgi:hypothetical protein
MLTDGVPTEYAHICNRLFRLWNVYRRWDTRCLARTANVVARRPQDRLVAMNRRRRPNARRRPRPPAR